MSKKVLLALVLGIMFGTTGLIVHQQRATAISWGTGCYSSAPAPYNIHYCVGYFTGNYVTNFYTAVNVLPSGLYANSGNFVGEIESYLGGADPTGNHRCVGRWTQCEAGAAFIIETMLGHGPFNSGVGAGISRANSDLPSWVSLVNSYINNPPSGYGVNFNGGVDCQSGALNSAWFTSLNDDAFHGADCAVDSTPEIVFSWPGGTFEIGQDCGNVDVSAALVPHPKSPSPWGSITLLCNNATAQYSAAVNFGDNNGFSTSGTISTNGWSSGVGSGSTTPIPTSVTSPYTSQSVTLTVSDDGTQARYSASTPVPCIGSPSCSLSLTSSSGLIDPYMPFSITANVTYHPSQAPPTPTSMKLVITNPAGAQAYNGSQNVNGNSPTSATFSVSALANGTGNYLASGTLTSQYFNTTCNTTIPVVNLPYLQVYGGDTMIGTSPDTSTLTCSNPPNTLAGIYSWNRNGSPDYSGAGDQFAVQALGQINGYASAQSSASSPPTGLSLANSPLGTNGSSGTRLASSDCNFTSDLSGAPVQGSGVTLPSSVSGTDTIYATGNVYIGNNVIYTGTGGWTSTSQIPYFKLIVVGGNIYIGSNVTELDGLYVAEPSGGTGGTIYTCATGGLPSPAYNPSGSGAIANYYSTCNKQLTIYGSFVAQQVEFLRTYGTVGQADYNGHSDSLKTYPLPVGSTYSAEVFDYTPEMWLPRDNSTPSNSYTAITGLPPVL